MSSREHDEYCFCKACVARNEQQESDDALFSDVVMTPDYPENGGYSTVGVEHLYQAFKRRLMREIVARKESSPLPGSVHFVTEEERYTLTDADHPPHG